ncbi:Long-chain-fatty-acid--CoA ligase [Alteripontixanthobacter maritimus]|uniref:Long-chain-fatty-acid--CoA ligase n=1 Tax=Alteripontixanthobacter maritimus TaxID=2161824 RepID=A0A369QD06_9SPHN|nr:long-chain fatty acid--CoA ligase [Alteripontixanthobacter maritimus]RDC61116.1 Long-chain-fatty-acid--CoA ligase [Alteripontixanthobacter maritimus]
MGQSADMDVSKPAYRHPTEWDLSLEAIPMPEFLRRSAQRTPDAALVDFMGRTYSYAEIWAEAQRFAAGLQARGVMKGDRIGLFLPNVPIYISAYYGAMLAGAVVVNFSPLYSADELSQQVRDSGTTMLVTLDVPALLPTAIEVLEASPLSQLVVGSLAAQLPTFKGIALRLFGRKQLTALPDRADVIHWTDMLGLNPAPVAIDADEDLALLQYTGGTTGTPKGAMLTHANLAANAQQVDALDPFDRSDPDIILGVLPMFHVFANTCVLNRTVVRGGMIAMLPRFEAKQALKAVNRVRPTAFPGVPTMYQALLDHPQIAKTDFSSLRVCISGGAALSAPTREKWEAVTGSRLCEGYGLTESAGVVSANPYDAERKPGTIGQVIPQTCIRLRDKEDAAKPAPEGEPGELVIRGPQVMRGYWNRPEAAKDAFVTIDGEAWLRTGDIAVIDDDGFIKIVDRSKDMIAVGGFKVFPSQVEEVLVEHEAVKEALVIGVPDDRMGERPKAFVTLNTGFEDTGGDGLSEWLNSRVGKHERVSGVVVRDDLPKTMIGKLDRKALRAEVLD